MNAERDGDGEREDGRKDIDEYGIFHRCLHDVEHVVAVVFGVAEVALHQSVELPVVVRVKAHPAQVLYDLAGIIRAVGALILEVGFLKYRVALFGGNIFQLLYFPVRLYVSAVARRGIVKEKHEERKDQQDYQHISQSLQYILSHILTSL